MAIQRKTDLIKKMIFDNIAANHVYSFFVAIQEKKEGIVFYIFKDPNIVTKMLITDDFNKNHIERHDLNYLQPEQIEFLFQNRMMIKDSNVLSFVSKKINFKWTNYIYQIITGLQPNTYKLSPEQIKELTYH